MKRFGQLVMGVMLVGAIAGAWTAVAYYSRAAYDSQEATLAVAVGSVIWLAEAIKGRGRGAR